MIYLFLKNKNFYLIFFTSFPTYFKSMTSCFKIKGYFHLNALKNVNLTKGTCR